MYVEFYGLTQKPFSLNPDPSFLYQSMKHQTALTLLEYGLLNQAAFSVITGEIGTGKTTLIHYLLTKMDRSSTVGLLSNTHQSFVELIQWISIVFKLDYRSKEKVELYKVLHDFLIHEYLQSRQVVLIIDEAQNMSMEALEELRMLSNINVDKNYILQIILVGQSGLRDMLRQPELKQFAQRIGVDYHLKPLDRVETHTYIFHRLKVAGGAEQRKIFTIQACDAIFSYSGGVPRLINLLCDTALVYGFAEGKSQIDAEVIDRVAHDKKQGGILPLRKKVDNFSDEKLDIVFRLHGAGINEHKNAMDNREGKERIITEPHKSAHKNSENMQEISLLATSSEEGAKQAYQKKPIDSATYNSLEESISQYPKESAIASTTSTLKYKRLKFVTGIVLAGISIFLMFDITKLYLQGGSQLRINPNTQNGLQDTRDSLQAPFNRSGDKDEKVIVVKKGDTLRHIIMQEYGQFNEEMINNILQWNSNIQDPDVINVGQVIRLPKKN
jgi:Type II secretory pathway, component ExeA (predicted ATPase)